MSLGRRGSAALGNVKLAKIKPKIANSFSPMAEPVFDRRLTAAAIRSLYRKVL
jgi:hypothetical protein